jgi:hypothetical protein
MAGIDFTKIEKEIEDLAKELFRGFVNQAKADGMTFVDNNRETFVRRTEQFRDGEISETNYKNGLLNLLALAKMERLKQEGLAKVQIDKFTRGVVDILIDAGLRAIA